MPQDCFLSSVNKTTMNTSPNITTDAQKKTSVFGLVFGMMAAPGQLLQKSLSNVSWAVAYGISGVAFLLFFLQTGLDMMRAGKMDTEEVVLLSGLGFLYGTLGVMIVGVFAWAGIQGFGKTHNMQEILRAFGLAYSPTLVYAVCGLVFNVVLEWNTAVAFGVTGLLWALNPISATIRHFCEDKTTPAVVLTTICGLLMLIGWAFLGGAL